MSVFQNLKPKTSLSSQELINLAFNSIQKTMLFVEMIYENLSDFKKEKIRSYLATDTNLLQAEAAINRQYLLAIAGDQTALERVEEGMRYWKQLITRKMEP